LVFIDESGVLLAPLVRRTLAPKGETPILEHRAKQRDKVSLIAALTIASSNIGAAQGSAADQSAHMRDFIQILLATAANKFWISAVGVACALIVTIYRSSVERAAHIARLGDAFDHALTDPEIAAAWCPPMATDEELDARLVTAAVRDRIAKLNFEPLNDALAETATVLKANAARSVITFGPAPGRGSGE
jgi:hypothetical protein